MIDSCPIIALCFVIRRIHVGYYFVVQMFCACHTLSGRVKMMPTESLVNPQVVL
jgi:hypothetical protein